MDCSLPDHPEGTHVAEDSEIETSRPLVALQPGIKRQSHDPGLGIQHLSTVFKSPRTNDVVKPVARHAYNSWLSDSHPSMRERHSAPGLEREDLNVALRSSKSAPDLRAPVLAAIRGLQDGSIQVDIRTRAKIAHAAKRVLEARELRRRTSQEAHRQGPSKLPYPRHEARSGTALPLQGAPVSPTQVIDDSDGQATVPAALGAPTGNIPATSLDLPRAEFKRPAGEDTGLQEDTFLQRFGELRPGRTSPFTVTTGAPRLSQEGSQTPPKSTKVRTNSTPIPVMQFSKSMTLASSPHSLDFDTGLSQAGREREQG